MDLQGTMMGNQPIFGQLRLTLSPRDRQLLILIDSIQCKLNYNLDFWT
jgi:hypothetical protein